MYNPQDMSVNIQPHCVVGIGASAGGLEALQQFLTFLPSNTGMAFVIIQHLAPNHKSMLVDILGKYNSMPFCHTDHEKQTRLEPDLKRLFSVVSDAVSLPHLTQEALSYIDSYLKDS